MNPADVLGRTWNSVVDFLLPRLCCGCGERILNEAWLVCEPCLDSIPGLLLPMCVTCGCPDAQIKSDNQCRNCPSGTIYFTKARGVAVFSGVAQTLIHRLKYERRIEYAPLVSLQMAQVYANDKDARTDAAEVVVPVPLHPTRRRERGFNQSEIIARNFSAIQKLPVSEKALIRTRATPSQTRLKKRQRRQNMAGAFFCKNAADIYGKQVLLIDDVYTTGSTLNECARILKEAGAKSVECLAYARAVLD